MNSADIMNNGVFCMHPWITQIKNPLGNVRLCPVKNDYHDLTKDIREAWNSPDITEVRRNMMNGTSTSKHCQSCYDLDKQHISSERTKSMEGITSERVQELLADTIEDGTLNRYPEYLSLSLDIECESVCVQCNRMNSKAWRNATPLLIENATHRVIQADFRTRYEFDDSSYDWSDQDTEFWPVFWDVVQNIKHLYLTGGEPLDSAKIKRLIAELSEQPYASNLILTINTGGRNIPDEMWDMFSKFKETTLLFSVDAVGKRAEWLRHPLKWEDLVANVKKADDLGIYFEFTANVHALNLAFIPEIYEWLWSMNLKTLHSHPIRYTFNHRPSYLDVRFVDQETKQFINQRLWDFYGQHNSKFEESYFASMMGCLDFMWQHKDSRKNHLIKEFVATMDKTRSTKFEDIFPELNSSL
jgi:hypothetical protein